MKFLTKIMSAVMTAILIFGMLPSLGSRADLEQPEVSLPKLDEINAAAYCVYDKTANEIILSSNPEERIFPASMTKIMTATLALDYLDTSAYLTASANALNSISSDSTVMGLVIGETTTVSELLYGLMLPSGNDAANVLAEGVIESLLKNYPSDSLSAGPDGINAKYFEDYFGTTAEDILAQYTLSAFALLMNYRAQSLGCNNTHFVNAHGLHDEMHYTTAYDLTKIMASAAERPDFCKLVHTPTHYFVATNMHIEDGWSIVNNSNKILMDPWLIARTAEGEDTHAVCVVGGKTGSTSIAGTGMTIFTVNENGHELFSAVCGIPYEFYAYQTRYVATVAAYGNLECWKRNPESVVPGTLGDYQSGNITEAERAQYDPLFLPGDIATEVEIPDPTSETQPDGETAATEAATVDDKDNKDEKKPAKETPKTLWGKFMDTKMVKWVKSNKIPAAIIGGLIFLILLFVIIILVKLGKSKKRRKKRKTRPYMGEIIKD